MCRGVSSGTAFGLPNQPRPDAGDRPRLHSTDGGGVLPADPDGRTLKFHCVVRLDEAQATLSNRLGLSLLLRLYPLGGLVQVQCQVFKDVR